MSPSEISFPLRKGWRPYRELYANAPAHQESWVRKRSVAWITSDPIPRRNSNDWLTWTLGQCGATETSLCASILMDADEKPVYVLKAVNYQVWQLTPSRKRPLNRT